MNNSFYVFSFPNRIKNNIRSGTKEKNREKIECNMRSDLEAFVSQGKKRIKIQFVEENVVIFSNTREEALDAYDIIMEFSSRSFVKIIKTPNFNDAKRYFKSVEKNDDSDGWNFYSLNKDEMGESYQVFVDNGGKVTVDVAAQGEEREKLIKNIVLTVGQNYD